MSSSLRYKIQQPTSNQMPYPAIFMIHGYGSNADDLFSFAPYLPQDHVIISLEAPLPLPQMGFTWYSIHFDAPQDQWTDVPQAKAALDVILKNIHALVAEHSIDPNNITLLGFSQGAILSWALALNNPNHFRRIVALSGYINQDLITSNTVTFSAFASHGKIDPVIPFEWAKETIEPLVKQNNEIQFHAFEAGHTVNQENFMALLEWLKQTQKD
ncbi:MAG: alpha/beta hydrolase [Flavobacteriaceae bacterium]